MVTQGLNTFQIVTMYIGFALPFALIALLFLYPVIWLTKKTVGLLITPIVVMQAQDADLRAAKDFAIKYNEYRKSNTDDRVFNKRKTGSDKEVKELWVL